MVAAICRLCRVLLSTPGPTAPAQTKEANAPPAEAAEKQMREKTPSSPPTESTVSTESETVSTKKIDSYITILPSYLLIKCLYCTFFYIRKVAIFQGSQSSKYERICVGKINCF